MLRALAGHGGRHLELYLMGISVALALTVPLAIEISTDEQELAITALAACVIQGLVFWSLRRRYRRVRQEMIAELRAMLQDRINNYLTIVLISVTQRRESPASSTERELLEAAIAATAAVSRVLEELSVESLRSWKSHYRLDEPAIRVAEVSPRRIVARSKVSKEPGTSVGLEQEQSGEAQQQEETADVGEGGNED